MMRFVKYPSGAVLCCAPHEQGAIIVVCADLTLTAHQRAYRACLEAKELIANLELPKSLHMRATLH